jgi:hypothetical protein
MARPAFVATDKQRGEVEAMHAYGVPEQAIADKIGKLKNGATTANTAVAGPSRG